MYHCGAGCWRCGRLCICGPRSIWEISVPSAQCCCEPKTTPKIEVYSKKNIYVGSCCVTIGIKLQLWDYTLKRFVLFSSMHSWLEDKMFSYHFLFRIDKFSLSYQLLTTHIVNIALPNWTLASWLKHFTITTKFIMIIMKLKRDYRITLYFIYK